MLVANEQDNKFKGCTFKALTLPTKGNEYVILLGR